MCSWATTVWERHWGRSDTWGEGEEGAVLAACSWSADGFQVQLLRGRDAKSDEAYRKISSWKERTRAGGAGLNMKGTLGPTTQLRAVQRCELHASRLGAPERSEPLALLGPLAPLLATDSPPRHTSHSTTRSPINTPLKFCRTVPACNQCLAIDTTLRRVSRSTVSFGSPRVADGARPPLQATILLSSQRPLAQRASANGPKARLWPRNLCTHCWGRPDLGLRAPAQPKLVVAKACARASAWAAQTRGAAGRTRLRLVACSVVQPIDLLFLE